MVQNKTVLVILLAAFGLAACGGGEPSAADLKTAIEDDIRIANEDLSKMAESHGNAQAAAAMKNIKIEIKNLEKKKCEKQSDTNSYSCDIEMERTLPNPLAAAVAGQTEKKSTSIVVYHINGSWQTERIKLRNEEQAKR